MRRLSCVLKTEFLEYRIDINSRLLKYTNRVAGPFDGLFLCPFGLTRKLLFARVDLFARGYRTDRSAPRSRPRERHCPIHVISHGDRCCLLFSRTLAISRNGAPLVSKLQKLKPI